MQCRVCNLPLTDATQTNTRSRPNGPRQRICRKCKNANRSISSSLLKCARKRARLKGIPCSITIGDIIVPDRCPVLGIALVQQVKIPSYCSPTLDRINPTKGYVRGNIIVVSARANSIKSNATPDEIMKVAEFYSQLKQGGGDNA